MDRLASASRDYRVMTNDPLPEQLGHRDVLARHQPCRESLPGSTSTADRFMRAGTYGDVMVQSDAPAQRRRLSMPASRPRRASARAAGAPVAAQKKRVSRIGSALSPHTLGVDLSKVDFATPKPFTFEPND